ncbi:MAG: acyltransferase [Planctomycetes bacterium]|nr:acyltransferase [Planctomycetota bacterium]
MKFVFIDQVLAVLSLFFLILIATAGAWCVYLIPMPSDLKGFVVLISFLFFLILCTILLLRIILYIIPMKSGKVLLGISKESVSWKLQAFLYVFCLGIIINTYIIPVNLRGLVFSFLGAEIGKGVVVGGKILEPPMVKIGNYTMLGEDSLITAHAVEKDFVALGKITIGNNVTVGVKAVILPGVEVGDNAIVAAGSIVTKDTKIPSREIWGGIPAKKIGEVPLNQ